MKENYVVAMYIRLSKEDSDISRSPEKEESNSITNQRLLLYEYLRSHPEFDGCSVIEKCDDGYSGKKFDRPQFMELMELAKQGKVNCILVKDFSRFGRDYIEIGDYLEQLFPFLGIRFIAVNDHYDSQEGGAETAGLAVAFKNFIYDFYSRDTSKKIRSVRGKMAQEGQFASANAPYGYLKSPDDKHRLVVDEEAAKVIRKIYDLRLSGLSAKKITRILNEEEIPSPAQYALDHRRGMDWRKINSKSAWNDSKVIAILKDERYAGNMVSLKRTLKGIYGKDTPVEQAGWARVQNTHEAIVSYEIFEQAQATFHGYVKRKPASINRRNIFVCGHCGRKLSYSKDRKKFICRYGETNPKAECDRAAYPAREMKEAVLAALKWHFDRFMDWQNLENNYGKQLQKEQDTSAYERGISVLETGRTRLYEKYREEKLSREEYLEQKKELNVQIEELQEKLQTVRAEIVLRQADGSRVEQFARLVHQYCGASELTKEMEELFVESVTVWDAEHIKIQWKFEDVFANL